MGLLANIDSLGEIKSMDVAAKKTLDENYPSYREAISWDEQEK